jgi:hypothetical protein
VAEDGDVAALDRGESDRRVDGGGLAGAVGAEKTEELAGCDIK